MSIKNRKAERRKQRKINSLVKKIKFWEIKNEDEQKSYNETRKLLGVDDYPIDIYKKSFQNLENN